MYFSACQISQWKASFQGRRAEVLIEEELAVDVVENAG